MRVVLDTDVMASAFRARHGASRAWLRAALQGEIILLLSVPLVIQYEEVLTRPEHLAAAGTDPTDEMVLEAAVNGRADQLLTFNTRDFAGARRFAVHVSTPGPAWQNWKERQA